MVQHNMHKSFFYDISIPGVTVMMNVPRPSTNTRDGMLGGDMRMRQLCSVNRTAVQTIGF